MSLPKWITAIARMALAIISLIRFLCTFRVPWVSAFLVRRGVPGPWLELEVVVQQRQAIEARLQFLERALGVVRAQDNAPGADSE